MSEPITAKPLSPEGQATLSKALYEQAQVWFEEATDLTNAHHCIIRERHRGHNYVEPRPTIEQIKSRQAILDIAAAVIDAARKRALEAFHTLMESSKREGRIPTAYEEVNGSEADEGVVRSSPPGTES